MHMMNTRNSCVNYINLTADKLIMYTIKRNEHTNCMWIIECVHNTLTFVYHRVKICFNVD